MTLSTFFQVVDIFLMFLFPIFIWILFLSLSFKTCLEFCCLRGFLIELSFYSSFPFTFIYGVLKSFAVMSDVRPRLFRTIQLKFTVSDYCNNFAHLFLDFFTVPPSSFFLGGPLTRTEPFFSYFMRGHSFLSLFRCFGWRRRWLEPFKRRTSHVD